MNNNLVDAIKARRSIREFIPGVVEGEEIRTILDCAACAPSAHNVRPCHFVVVKDRAVLKAMAEKHPYGKMLGSAGCAVLVCGDTAKNGGIASDYCEIDCAAAMENLLLGVEAIGLGGVWLGMKSQELQDVFKGIFGIPSDVMIVGIAAVGHTDKKPRPHSGASEDQIHMGSW